MSVGTIFFFFLIFAILGWLNSRCRTMNTEDQMYFLVN